MAFFRSKYCFPFFPFNLGVTLGEEHGAKLIFDGYCIVVGEVGSVCS